MNNNNIFDEVKIIYEQATKEKDIARKLDYGSEYYKIAAKLFQESSEKISTVITNKNNHDDYAGRILSNYYMFEALECKAAIEYYSHNNMDKAEQFYKDSIKYLKSAIEITEENLSYLTNDKRINYDEILQGWKSSHINVEALILGAKARKAWDSKDFITARDFYYEMVIIAKNNLEYIEKCNKVKPVYKRIALGNYIAFRGNYVNAFGAILAEKAKNNNGIIDTDDFIRLLDLTLESFYISKDAYNVNPEWEQYNHSTKRLRKNLKSLLESNLNSWPLLHYRYNNNSEVTFLMKEIDTKYFNSLTSPKTKNWSIFSLFIILLLTISGIAYLFLNSGKNIFLILSSLLFIETMFNISGAFILRYSDKLSEKSFMKLIFISLKNQFGAIKFLKDKSIED